VTQKERIIMYALRDAEGKFVAHARTSAAAHRTSRRAHHLGTSVNRAYGDRTFSELPVGRTFWFTAKRTTVRGATYKQNRGPYVKVSEQRYRDLDDVAGKFLYEVSRRSVSVRDTPPDANRAGKRVLEVIPARRWRHKSGRTASPYGALPWTGAPGNTKADWTMETSGWTWANADGTIGLGRVPAATREEAEAIMDRVNAR
jgi:hypothetical protein